MSSSCPPDYLRAQLQALGCQVDRVEESFIHSGGAGGQNVNKVATCVQLKYPPARLLVKMQEHRTQAANRLAAWKLLARLLQQAKERAIQERKVAREKKRRQNAPRPGWLKARLRQLKRSRSQKKQARHDIPDES